MRQSFMGTPLLSPPPLPALGRRVDYRSMKKKEKKINIFLFIQLLFFIYSVFVGWKVLIIVDQTDDIILPPTE